MKHREFFKIEIALLMALVITVLSSLTGFARNCEKISDSVLRLHVIANSDTEEDQQLKLKVRDAILEKGKDIFDGSVTRDEAKARIEPNIAQLEETAKKVIEENGFDYDVKITVTEEYFATRVYEEQNITLPAGRYMAVRAVIGEGNGHNWWCIMFPPLCLPAAEGEVEIDSVLDEEQMKIVQKSPKYEPRFKIIEWYQRLAEKFDK
ncbi:MAG: stage II sporulation protein R [Clostridiales bacterium]|nr:stage II sporulation protein R [Clostridiales bacterium]